MMMYILNQPLDISNISVKIIGSTHQSGNKHLSVLKYKPDHASKVPYCGNIEGSDQWLMDLDKSTEGKSNFPIVFTDVKADPKQQCSKTPTAVFLLTLALQYCTALLTYVRKLSPLLMNNSNLCKWQSFNFSI